MEGVESKLGGSGSRVEEVLVQGRSGLDAGYEGSDSMVGQVWVQRWRSLGPRKEG